MKNQQNEILSKQFSMNTTNFGSAAGVVTNDNTSPKQHQKTTTATDTMTNIQSKMNQPVH